MSDYAKLSPKQLRALMRNGHYTQPTAGLALGYAQANLVILKQELAFDFLLFCQRNAQACPVLEVLEPGCFEAKFLAPGSDLRTDLPRYRVFRDGVLMSEPLDITALWRGDFVSFLLGCSFSFEAALVEQSLEVRHISEGRNVPMYVTNIPCREAGVFSGPLVVSMRPFAARDVAKAVQITGRYRAVHGAPVHIGDPAALGIKDIARPDMGEAVTVHAGELPVFWACGCTPQAVVMQSKPDLVITHAPGHMFVTDLRDKDLETIGGMV
ncbi:MAG: hypothetical protein DDT37_00314 [Firmicutes bacterium]|nr:hypothetical protein [candidate division NPL-UPA2 bacterium]